MVETNPRLEKGREIAEKGDQIIRIDDNHYQVKSQSSDRIYDVIATESGFICNCPDATFRKVCCKHIHSCEISIKLRKEIQNRTIEPVNIMICPQCQSAKVVRHGVRHNKNYDIQRLSCKDCKFRFSVNLGFQGMKASPEIITSSMQLYFTGESFRNVQKFLKLQGVEVSHQTIYNWVSRYVELMDKYLDSIVPKVGDVWRSDEIYMKIKGDRKYLYALMDNDSRFWIAQEVADKKYTHDVKSLFREGIVRAEKRPRLLITDGAPNFADASSVFYSNQAKKQTIHIRHIHIRGDKNNNRMERLNGEIRDREKVMRGIKKNDSPVLKGYQLYHNYIRPHMALDEQTPADKVGIKINGKNKWITLIQNGEIFQTSPHKNDLYNMKL